MRKSSCDLECYWRVFDQREQCIPLVRPVEGHGRSCRNSRVTARDRCSLADATLKEVISGMQHTTAASTVGLSSGSPRGNENDGE
jgi:hypothetical protein